MEGKRQWMAFSGCLVMAFLVVGLCNNTWSLYIADVTEKLDIGRGAFTFTNSISSVVSAVLILCYGRLHAWLGVRRLAIIGAACGLAAYLLYATAVGVTQLYLAAVLYGALLAGCANSTVAVLINGWFQARVGMLLGIIYAGTSVGGTVFNPLIAAIINKWGFRAGYGVTAAAVAVVLAVLVAFVREAPCYEKRGDAAREDLPGLPFAQVLRTPRFWLTVVMSALVGLCLVPIQTTIAAHLGDQGHSLLFASAMLSVFYAVSALTKIPMGILADKAGLRTAYAVAVLALAVAAAALTRAGSAAGCVLAALSAGVGIVIMTVLNALIPPLQFGYRDMPQVNGVYGAVTMGSTAVGVYAANAVFDRVGSYLPVYLTYLILLGAALVLAVLVLPGRAGGTYGKEVCTDGNAVGR